MIRHRSIAACCAFLMSACAIRASIPAPTEPYATTPQEALPAAPDSAAGGSPIRFEFARRSFGAAPDAILVPRETGGIVSVFLGLRLAPAAGESPDATTSSALLAALRRDEVVSFSDGGELAIEGDANADGVRLNFRVAAERLAESLAIAERWVRAGTIDDGGVRAARIRCEEQAASDESSIDGQVDEAADELLYDERDPRRTRSARRSTDCRALSVARLEARRRELLDASGLTVVIVGQFEVDDATAALESTLGRWTDTDQPRGPLIGPTYRDDGPRAIGFDRSLMRTWIYGRERAPALGHEDHAAFLVLERLLGGMFTSRTNLSIREASGASYRAGASYTTTCAEGTLEIQTSVEQDVSRSVVALLVDEQRRVSGEERGISRGEFERARTQAFERLASRVDDSLGLANRLGDLIMCGISPRRLGEILGEIDALTVERVEAVARRWLRPDRSTFVIVGSAEELRLIHQYFGWGAMENRRARAIRTREVD